MSWVNGGLTFEGSQWVLAGVPLLGPPDEGRSVKYFSLNPFVSNQANRCPLECAYCVCYQDAGWHQHREKFSAVVPEADLLGQLLDRIFAISLCDYSDPFVVVHRDRVLEILQALIDRVVQQALLNLLHPVLEPQFEDASFAYRPGRSYLGAVRQIDVWRKRGYDWVLDADVVKYFDNVRHDRLYAELQERVHDDRVGDLVQQWMGSGVMTAGGLVLPEKGIPQGAVVSPILANVYFDDFDEAIAGAGLKLVRYADDFVILGKTRTRIDAAYGLVEGLLKDMGLVLHPGKTQVTNFDGGFRFLGHTFVKSLIVPDTPKKRKVAADGKPMKRMDEVRIDCADLPVGRTQMQMAFEAALRGREPTAVVPPPLYVVMGYKVRDTDKKVEITSNEFVWRNGMSTLYLVKQGMALRKEQGRFFVKAGSEGKTEREVEVPIREVERVLVFGNIQLSTAVIGACLEAQIPVVFLSQMGSYKGHLWSGEFCDLPVEAAQYGRRQDGEFQVMMARSILDGKLANSRQLLLRLNRKRKVDGVMARLGRMEQHRAAIGQISDLDVLRGHEGAAARLYFGVLGQMITNDGFSLTGRSRRPPKDPVNSLLSFGYTLLFNNVLSVILAEGLNPYLGNLHRSDRKEPHLAFDLMEEWRSVIVDSLVMVLINKKILRPTDFSYPNAEGGVYLTDQSRRVFLKYFEERISAEISYPGMEQPISYRRAIQFQVQRYKKCLMGSMPYEPFLRK